jgi:preprotein translocase subunit YajC
MKNLEEIFTGTAEAQTSSPGAAPANAKGGAFGMFLPMILVFVIFYFLMIRPQTKQKKKHQELIKNLKKGDDVVTTAGIHGKVAGVADNIVTLEIAENIRIKLDRPQVATVKANSSLTV